MSKEPRELPPEGLTVVTVCEWTIIKGSIGPHAKLCLSDKTFLHLCKQRVTKNNVAVISSNFVNLCKQLVMYEGGNTEYFECKSLEVILDYVVKNKTNLIVRRVHRENQDCLFLDVHFVNPLT